MSKEIKNIARDINEVVSSVMKNKQERIKFQETRLRENKSLSEPR